MATPSIPFYVKALHEYKSDFEDDLSFSPGQTIEITNIEDEEWFTGNYDGKSGMFPKNFVEIIHKEPEIPIPARPAKKDHSGGDSAEIGGANDNRGSAKETSSQNDASSEEPLQDKQSPLLPKSNDFGTKTEHFPSPLNKVNDPYLVKKQFVAAGKSSYIPKITPREDRTHHGHDDTPKNNSEIVKSSTNQSTEIDDEPPKVSLKQRIALLQQKQQEEAEREQLALKKKQERKKKLEDEKKKRLDEAALEVNEERNHDDFNNLNSNPVERHTTGGSINSGVSHNFTSGSVNPGVASHIIGGSVNSGVSHNFTSGSVNLGVASHITGGSAKSILDPSNEESGHLPRTSIDEHSPSFVEENEAEDEVSEEFEQQLRDVIHEQEQESDPESDDEELKRRKLVERMAKISGGRNMFGMMGMPSPFGTSAPAPEKAKKLPKPHTSDHEVNKPIEQHISPSQPSHNPSAPTSAPTNITGLDGNSKSIETRNVGESSHDVFQRRDSLNHPGSGSIGAIDNKHIPVKLVGEPMILPNSVNDERSVNLLPEAGYDADEDVSDANKSSKIDTTSPSFGAAHPIPQVPVSPITRNLDQHPEATALSPSLLHRRTSSKTKAAPPPPPNVIGGEENDIRQHPSAFLHVDQAPQVHEVPVSPSSISNRHFVDSFPPPPPIDPKVAPPPPPFVSTNTSDSVIEADNEDSSDGNTFTPSVPTRAQTTGIIPPPLPNFAPPPIGEVPPPPPKAPARSRTDIDHGNFTDSRKSSELERKRSVREQSQAEAVLRELKSEIESPRSKWWYYGELPESLNPRLGSDLTFETDVNEIRKRNGRFIIIRDFYILFYDLSQIVIEVQYDNQDSYKSLNYYTNAVPEVNRDLLTKYNHEFSGAIAGIASSLLGKNLNEDFVTYVLNNVGQQNHHVVRPIGDKSYGVTIYRNFNNVNVRKIDDIRLGDILWIKLGKFVSQKLLGKHKNIVGDDNDTHTAIIYDFDVEKEKFKVYEQENGNIKKESHKISDFQSGKIRVFRVIGRDYIGWN